MIGDEKPRKCCISSDKPRIRCKEPYFGSLKVQVRHNDTGRKTWQTWHLCRPHWDNFLNVNGEGYYAWYNKKPNKRAFVINFNLIGAL